MKKLVLVIGSLCALLSMFKLNAVFAETKISEDVKESIEVNGNMDDLPIDLLKDVEVAPYEENKDRIFTNEKDFAAEINLEENKINFSDAEGNEITVLVDDPDLKFENNEDGTIIFTNAEEDYSVENQILDGGFRQIFSIDSKEAPKEFKIDIEMKEDYSLVEEEGMFYIKDSYGNNIYNIGKAWAVDSLGNFVETKYEVKNQSLYQTVNYSGDNYPVKADPLFCSDTIDNTSTKWDKNYSSGKGTFSVYTRTCTKAYITAHWALGPSSMTGLSQAKIMLDMWSEVTADADFKKYISSSKAGRIKDQFICHAANPLTIYKSSWNLEPWRPDKTLVGTYMKGCNPE